MAEAVFWVALSITVYLSIGIVVSTCIERTKFANAEPDPVFSGTMALLWPVVAPVAIVGVVVCVVGNLVGGRKKA